MRPKLLIKASALLLFSFVLSSAQSQQDQVITVLGDILSGQVTLPETWSEFVYFGDNKGDTTSRITPGPIKFFIHRGERYETMKLPVPFDNRLSQENVFVKQEKVGEITLAKGNTPLLWVTSPTGTAELIIADDNGKLSRESFLFVQSLVYDCPYIEGSLENARATYSSLKSLLTRYVDCDIDPDAELVIEEIEGPALTGNSFESLGEWWFGAEFGIESAQWGISSNVLKRHNQTITDGLSPTFGLSAMQRLKDGNMDLFVRGSVCAQVYDFEFTGNVEPESIEGNPIYILNYRPVYATGRLGFRLAGSDISLKGFGEIGASVAYQYSFDWDEIYIYGINNIVIQETVIPKDKVKNIHLGAYAVGGVMLNRVGISLHAQYLPALLDYEFATDGLFVGGVGLSYWVF